MSYRVKIDPHRCKSCELCVAVCPKKILEISDERNELGFHVAVCRNEQDCTGCLACALVCPDLAIEIEKEPDK